MKIKLTIIALIFIFLLLMNFIMLSIHSKKIGGDSISGYKKNGQYYILNVEGKYVEIDKTPWLINKSLWISCFIFGFLGGLGFLFLIGAYIFPVAIKNAKKLLE